MNTETETLSDDQSSFIQADRGFIQDQELAKSDRNLQLEVAAFYCALIDFQTRPWEEQGHTFWRRLSNPPRPSRPLKRRLEAEEEEEEEEYEALDSELSEPSLKFPFLKLPLVESLPEWPRRSWSSLVFTPLK